MDLYGHVMKTCTVQNVNGNRFNKFIKYIFLMLDMIYMVLYICLLHFAFGTNAAVAT